jgi:hypothetical protein
MFKAFVRNDDGMIEVAGNQDNDIPNLVIDVHTTALHVHTLHKKLV